MTKNKVCDIIGLTFMWAVIMTGSLVLIAFMFYAVDHFNSIGICRYVLAFIIEAIDVALLYFGVWMTQITVKGWINKEN